MILGLKIAAGIILSLFFVVAVDCAFCLINAPDDMSVIIGIGIFLAALVAAVALGAYFWKKLIRWLKNNGGVIPQQGEKQ